MLGFLQGFAYGLFLSCLPWFITGIINPRLALPTEPPRRWQVFLRYGLLTPFIAFILWLTSLWGGFSPSLEGWLVGLAALAVEIPVERRWRRARQRRAARRQQAALDAASAKRQARLEQEQREAGNAVLDPEQPPVGADDLVLALCHAKRELLQVHRPELATQADRLYTRYMRVLETLQNKFDPRELTLGRWQQLIAEVGRGAVDNLKRMASLAKGIDGIDPEYIRRRLSQPNPRLPEAERTALQRRQQLFEETEHQLRELSAANETALTALDDARVAIARIELSRPQANLAADLALQELRRYIDRAKLYEHRK